MHVRPILAGSNPVVLRSTVSLQEEVDVVPSHTFKWRDAGSDAALGSTGEIEEDREAMSLSSVGNPAWETIRGVRFAMLYAPTLVAVLVTHAALDDIELAPRGVGGHLACFNKHRDAIEQVASTKHQRGQLEESGSVIVQAGDLKSSGS